MKNYFYRSLLCFAASFFVLLSFALVMHFPSGARIAELVPGALAILISSVIAAPVSAALIRTRNLWAVLLSQMLTISLIFVIYYLI